MSAISKTFGVVSTAAKSTDNFSGAFKALSGLNKVSGTASLLKKLDFKAIAGTFSSCLLYTSPSPRDGLLSRMPSSA